MSDQNKAKQEKRVGHRWKPGQSGNPGGRPKTVAEIRELLKSHAPMAVARLVELAGSKNEAVAERAASAILDRAGIRPIAAEGDKIEVVGEGGAALARLTALLARGTAAEPEAGGDAAPPAEPVGVGR